MRMLGAGDVGDLVGITVYGLLVGAIGALAAFLFTNLISGAKGHGLVGLREAWWAAVFFFIASLWMNWGHHAGGGERYPARPVAGLAIVPAGILLLITPPTLAIRSWRRSRKLGAERNARSARPGRYPR
jgi:hypothetical protein